MKDKRIVDSRYSPRIPKLTRKVFMLFVCIVLLTLMFSKVNNENRSYTTGFFTILICFLVTLPIFYTMKVSFYTLLLYIIIIVLLGSLGYGWGIIGVVMNLDPLGLKKKKSNEKKISA